MFVVSHQAGEDRKWLMENTQEFEERAKAGDEYSWDILKEMQTRSDLKDAM